MKRILFIFILFFLLINSSCKRVKESFQNDIPLRNSTPFVIIHKETLYVEISYKEEEREVGLMFREKLDENRGMLFIFENERLLLFWMRNTKVPLSIAFINSKEIIVDIQDMEPMTETAHRSRFPAIYALEVNQGWFKKHNVEIGDNVSLHFWTTESREQSFLNEISLCVSTVTLRNLLYTNELLLFFSHISVK